MNTTIVVAFHPRQGEPVETLYNRIVGHAQGIIGLSAGKMKDIRILDDAIVQMTITNAQSERIVGRLDRYWPEVRSIVIKRERNEDAPVQP